MDSLKETADQGRATTNVRKAELGPLCFQDDVAAVSNKKIDAIKNQAVLEVFQHRKRLQLHPEKPDDCHKEK